MAEPKRAAWILVVLGVAAMSEAANRQQVSLASLCLLEGDAYARQEYVLEAARRALEGRRTDLLVTPFLPILSFREGQEGKMLQPFAALAKRHKCYLAVALTEERTDGRKSHTSLLLGRDGKPAGKHRQAHAFPDDDGLALGDDLPVFRTDFGTLGLMVGSDFHFPEAAWVERMKGAEVLVWQSAPERFRQHHELLPLLTARCLDSHAHLVTAMYADRRTYITNRYTMGMRGAAWGRSMVLNRVGVALADTGYDAGVAGAVVDLDHRKENVYAPFYQGENVFFCNCLGDRKAFAPLAEPTVPAPRPAYLKRAARIAVGYLPETDIWHDDAVPEGMLRLIDQAAEVRPDLLLLTEMSAKIGNATTRRAAGMVAERARKLHCYLVIGGIGDEHQISIARVWDREGREVFGEPIYWTKGFATINVYDTDFARIGIHTCGDLYTGEIDRVLAVKGAELILDPSQHWGADGDINELMLRARAADNGVWLACAHWNSSDSGLRSLIVDPYGTVTAASGFQRTGVVHTDIDFDDLKVYYAGRKAEQPQPGADNIPSYFAPDMPEQRPGWREMMLARRRPELYGILPESNEVIRRYRPEKSPWE